MTVEPYKIRNSRGVVVATINPATTTGTVFPIKLPGNGFPLYGEFVDQNQYLLLENFANETPPVNPVEGQYWYNFSDKTENYWDGTAWRTLVGANSTNSTRFPMLVEASAVDLTLTGTTRLFNTVGPYTYHPVSLMLFPVSVSGAFDTPAVINLSTVTPEDILENIPLGIPTPTRFSTYPISGMTEPVWDSRGIDLNVSSPFTGTDIVATYKAVIFGLID